MASTSEKLNTVYKGSRGEVSNQLLWGVNIPKTQQHINKIQQSKQNLILRLLFADSMLPGHFSLFFLVGEQRLGYLAWHGPRNRPQVLFRDASFPQVGFWGKSRSRVVVMIVGVGDVNCVWMVVVKVHVMVVMTIWGYSWGYAQRGRVTAARSGLEGIQNFGLGDAVAHGEVGALGFLRVRGPGLAARHGVQGVGSCRRLGGGLGEVALAQGGDATAGAAGEGGVTAIQD